MVIMPRAWSFPHALVNLLRWPRRQRKTAFAIVGQSSRFRGNSAWRMRAFSLSVGRLSARSL
eukprot:11633484-Alexandrium_andersonii.AAC.1